MPDALENIRFNCDRVDGHVPQCITLRNILIFSHFLLLMAMCVSVCFSVLYMVAGINYQLLFVNSHTSLQDWYDCPPVPITGTSSSVDSPLSSSITFSLFHSRLKTFLFANPPHRIASSSFSSSSSSSGFFRTESTDSPDCLPILLSISILIFSFFFFPYYLVLGSVR